MFSAESVKDGRQISTSSHCTKRSHFAPMTSTGVRVEVIVEVLEGGNSPEKELSAKRSRRLLFPTSETETHQSSS